MPRRPVLILRTRRRCRCRRRRIGGCCRRCRRRRLARCIRITGHRGPRGGCIRRYTGRCHGRHRTWCSGRHQSRRRRLHALMPQRRIQIRHRVVDVRNRLRIALRTLACVVHAPRRSARSTCTAIDRVDPAPVSTCVAVVGRWCCGRRIGGGIGGGISRHS